MIIFPCLFFLFSGGYVTYVFLLIYVFSLLLCFIRR